MTPAQRMQIERRLCSLVDEDPGLHVAVVEAAGETKDLSRDGSLALGGGLP